MSSTSPGSGRQQARRQACGSCDLRVVDPSGFPPGLGRSLVRLAGLALAILLVFTGFLPALVDDRRRALQDFLAGTVVLYTEA